ncbi:ABC transporter substrate-binding protein [Fusibacter paucivorans]|uniref:ABC transporter substrate-binding protein n=1 Tax=Fusibacter paucivorans TaxID=76009 RepID=A0ABS5PV43_9FIRM|nr:ABC transporter substrate-binding protein [Fusibacter paucivorans]MBS7527957.1 ABC transporter substrate-binding protein [Fusibacter paucivorans]
MKKMILAVLCILLAASLIGCGKSQAETAQAETAQAETVQAETEKPEATSAEIPSDEARTITDLGGNVIKLPPASAINRVVVMNPPSISMLLSILPDTKKIIGANANAFERANPEILEKMFPEWQNVETGFMIDGFVANTEEILKLEPDLVFYYGNMQKPGIENLGIPIVDMMIKGENNPEKVSVAWDNLMREIFEVEASTTLAKEWEMSNDKAQKALSTYEGEAKSAIYLLSNMGGVITVFGSGTYADTWFEKGGLVNAASDVKGQSEVSMEQMHEWDPDYIFVFKGTPASVMLANQVKGQDWSLLSAYEHEAIFDIPQTIFSWGAPCSDSPLMPLWLISKSHPDLLDEDEFSKLFKAYYERVYDIELDDEFIQSILNGREETK